MKLLLAQILALLAAMRDIATAQGKQPFHPSIPSN